MTKAKQRALLKRLGDLRISIVAIDGDSVTINGDDYYKVLVMAKGGSLITSPVGTKQIKLT